MGPIVDRSKEHLGPADKAIIQARKLLRQAVMTVEAGGKPDGTGTSYYTLRAHEAVLPNGADWRQTVTPEMPEGMILQTV
jgi:phthalate 4,5-dioxygenase